MSSLNADFKELLERIRQGREFGHASFEPVYYLVFPPSQILEVKRQTPAWEANLKNNGWNVHKFSLAEAVLEILGKAPQRQLWINADAKAPTQWSKTNKSLANSLENGPLLSMLEDTLAGISDDNNILIVTDLEALHPYLRIGTIEGQLIGQFKVPTILLYPGERTGKSRLKFLGFYPEDGNYRSMHIGG